MAVRACVAVALAAIATPSHAQSRTFTACTPDAVAVCAQFRLESAETRLDLGIRLIGSIAQPDLPLALYNLVFATGAAPASTPLETDVTPIGSGGATLTNPVPWNVFDTGDLLFLSALSNRGVGGCVGGDDVGGFGQAARTCGAGQFVSFGFATTQRFDPAAFTLLDLEAVGLTDPTAGFSCGAADAQCVVAEDTPGQMVTPEPAPLATLGAGLLALRLAIRRRRV